MLFCQFLKGLSSVDWYRLVLSRKNLNKLVFPGCYHCQTLEIMLMKIRGIYEQTRANCHLSLRTLQAYSFSSREMYNRPCRCLYSWEPLERKNRNTPLSKNNIQPVISQTPKVVKSQKEHYILKSVKDYLLPFNDVIFQLYSSLIPRQYTSITSLTDVISPWHYNVLGIQYYFRL